MISKQMHRDEFRLRLLVTDGCDRDCYFCLNDFQPKPRNHPIFMTLDIARRAISAYILLCRVEGILPRISISGGEPAIVPDLVSILRTAHDLGGHVQLNTNGLAFETIPLDQYFLVDSWRVGDFSYNAEVATHLAAVKGIIQLVVTRKNINRIQDIISSYIKAGIPIIKLFVDFKEDITFWPLFKFEYMEARQKFGEKIISRFTGVQENRGPLCDNCTKKCITLKALWVMPNGATKACPQDIDCYDSDWSRVMRRAYDVHSRIPIL